MAPSETMNEGTVYNAAAGQNGVVFGTTTGGQQQQAGSIQKEASEAQRQVVQSLFAKLFLNQHDLHTRAGHLRLFSTFI